MAETILSPLGEPLTDLGNAERFVRAHAADLRYVKTWRRWLWYDGRRWARDATGEAERRAKDTLRLLVTEAAQLEDEKERSALLHHALRSSNSQRVRSLLELASTEPEVATGPDVFDQAPWTLNVLNGTLDLQTATLRAPAREDLLTKVAPIAYEPAATCPRWDRFLEEIFPDDREIIEFVQRAVGYTLTGDTREQCLFFCHGQGANGKSVFLELLHDVLGTDYAQAAPFATFLARQQDGPRNDLARMRGARLVSASEAPGGRALDEAVLKQIVGGDTVTARFLHEEFFEFRPEFKLWLRANHRPPVREQTIAFWRRVRLIPFSVVIPPEQRDPDLSAKLTQELPGILAWAVRGCLAWAREGLGAPAAVTQATESYRAENDFLGEFLDARCLLEPGVWTATSDLYTAFTAWWEQTHGRHDRPPSRVSFGRALGERSDVAEARSSERTRTRGWRGLRLNGNGTHESALQGALDGDGDVPF